MGKKGGKKAKKALEPAELDRGQLPHLRGQLT